MFRLCGIETSRRLYKKAVYMMMHLAMGIVTCGLATLFWHSRVAHSTFILAICGASVWNAAGFYFTVFAQRCAHLARFDPYTIALLYRERYSCSP
jgi:hypothetical protein